MATFLSLSLGLGLVAGVGLWFGRRLDLPRENQVGWPLWGVCGGLLVYLYVGAGLPGTAVWAGAGPWSGLFAALAGGILGLVGYAWRHRDERRREA
jgi:hypothetical protein